MRIGVLVGKDNKGGCHYIGKPGEITDLDEIQRKITDAGGKHGKIQLVKTWLADATVNPLKAKKCVGSAVVVEPDDVEE